MGEPRKKILYIHHTSVVGGASWSLYQILSALRSEYEIIVVLVEEGPLLHRLPAELGVRTILDKRIKGFTTAFGGSRSPLWSVNRRGILAWRSSVAAAKEICLRERPDVVHLNTFVLFNTAIGCKQAGVPRVVMHVREPLLFKPGTWRDSLMRKTVRESVDQVLAITQANANEVGFPEKTVIVPNWPDFTGRCDFVDLGKEYQIPPDRKIILCMGERHRHKGSLTAIQAMRKVRDPKAFLLVLGGRPTGGLLKRSIRKTLSALHIATYGLQMDWAATSLPDRIRLAGVSLSIKSIIEQSTFLISPFIRPHFAKTIIEAAILEKPSIVSAGAPQDESVVHGQTGLVIPAGEADALAQAINELLENPQRTLQMGAAAKQFVAERYDKARSIALIRRAYEA